MRHRRWRLGGCHNFVGVGGGFPGEPQSSTATVACGMCISPPPSQHAGSWGRRGGDVAVVALCQRAWVVCAGRMAVRGGQGVQFGDFLYVQEHRNGRCKKWLIKSENCDGST